jgi:hypothetical protein
MMEWQSLIEPGERTAICDDCMVPSVVFPPERRDNDGICVKCGLIHQTLPAVEPVSAPAQLTGGGGDHSSHAALAGPFIPRSGGVAAPPDAVARPGGFTPLPTSPAGRGTNSKGNVR